MVAMSGMAIHLLGSRRSCCDLLSKKSWGCLFGGISAFHKKGQQTQPNGWFCFPKAQAPQRQKSRPAASVLGSVWIASNNCQTNILALTQDLSGRLDESQCSFAFPIIWSSRYFFSPWLGQTTVAKLFAKNLARPRFGRARVG
jgi:hypothetical protein